MIEMVNIPVGVLLCGLVLRWMGPRDVGEAIATWGFIALGAALTIGQVWLLVTPVAQGPAPRLYGGSRDARSDGPVLK